MTKLALPTRRALRYDGDSASVQYVGEARFGVSESEASWRIFRLTYTGGSISQEWADGNDNFDNIWADRASLSYS
jgi:hypothetical protein